MQISQVQKWVFASVALVLGAGVSQGSLVVNLQFADGTTSRNLTSADIGTTIPVLVYATIKTPIAVTPGNHGAGGNHDAFWYMYFDVLSSLTAGHSAVDGQFTSASLDQGLGTYSAFGSQTGVLQDANSDGVTDLGPATSTSYTANDTTMLNLPKESPFNPVWEDTDSSPTILISADRLSVSYLLETLNFKVNSLSGQQTTFLPVTPGLPPIYAAANWFEDVPTESTAPSGTYKFNSGETAGTGVTFLAPTAAVPEPRITTVVTIGVLAGLIRRRRAVTVKP